MLKGHYLSSKVGLEALKENCPQSCCSLSSQLAKQSRRHKWGCGGFIPPPTPDILGLKRTERETGNPPPPHKI
jgi:hypothetical protein